MPPLTMQDRHPSAPQLASMLASSVDSKPLDIMMDSDEQVCELKWFYLGPKKKFFFFGGGNWGRKSRTRRR